jgi:hypothetical protein
MMDIKPFAEVAEVDEEVMKKLVENYNSIVVIKAICGLLKADIQSRVEFREVWLNTACNQISEKKILP